MVSYETVVGRYNLSESQLQEECDEEVLEEVAPKLEEWRNIRPYLRLGKGAATAIDRDKSDEEGKRREMLYRWKQTYGHQATYEKLIRALLEASRTDLAEIMCKIYASHAASGVDTCKQTCTPEADDMKPGPRPFISPHPAINDDSGSSSRSLPKAPQMLRQRKEFNAQSMQEVGNSPPDLHVKARQVTAAVPENTIWSVLSLLKREKDEKDEIKQSLEKKVKELEQKVEELLETRKNQMENREKELEKSLTESDKMISCNKKELCQAQSELDSETRKQKETEKYLEQKDKKIEWLQDNVYQKERELGQERDEKEEKSSEKENKIQEPKSELEREKKEKEKETQEPKSELEREKKEKEKETQELKSELETEKKEKEITNEGLDQISTRIETLQKDVKNVTSKVTENDMERDKIRMEMEEVKAALVRTKQELDDEKRANNKWNSKLAQLHKYMIILQVFIMIALFAALFLHSRNLFFIS